MGFLETTKGDQVSKFTDSLGSKRGTRGLDIRTNQGHSTPTACIDVGSITHDRGGSWG